MASNSVITASIPKASKDLGKKKRANRSAKLKQCKLHARREQWLSLGAPAISSPNARNKACKDDRNAMFVGEVNSPSTEVGDKHDNRFVDLETRRQGVENNYTLIHIDSDSESPAHSPTSSLSGGNDMGNSFTGGDSSSTRSRSCSSSSSFSSGGCCSGSISDEEEGGGGDDDGCLDDWEAIADALAADDNPSEHPSSESPTEKEAVQTDVFGPVDQGCEGFETDKPKSEQEVAAVARAWREDDAFRPQSLPSLLKQKSFPMNSEKHSWGFNHALSVPTSCPICCEELDLTDSSFLPCLCGFRLCLFCHKRIIEGDNRCPGCRKTYELDAVQKQASVSGGPAAVRLARSCSMFSRT